MKKNKILLLVAPFIILYIITFTLSWILNSEPLTTQISDGLLWQIACGPFAIIVLFIYDIFEGFTENWTVLIFFAIASLSIITISIIKIIKKNRLLPFYILYNIGLLFYFFMGLIVFTLQYAYEH